MSIDTGKITKKYIVKRDLKNIFPKEFTGRELIGKFFDYVMNNFFQSSFERYINGYIGRKTNTLEEGNFYVKEPNMERELYQLSPMLIDNNEDKTEIKGLSDYVNFIKTLKMQGCLTNDHNRLLSNEHWSYCPPIDPDMFLNFNFYYWIEEGLKPINLEEHTNVIVEIEGEKNTGIIGKPSFRYYYTDKNGKDQYIDFSNGLRVTFLNDANQEYNGRTFIVEGVGQSIILVDDTEIYTDDDKSPDYFVMERGCIDKNPWSLRNRWFHIDVIKISNEYNQEEDTTITYQQAKYPILCFNRDIELYNFGNFDRGTVSLITNKLKNTIQGQYVKNDIDGGKLRIDNVLLDTNDIILFTGEQSSETNNMLYKLYLLPDGDDRKVVTFYPVINGKNSDGTPSKGECIKLKNNIQECWYYNGTEWVPGQQKDTVCQSPLFNLYDTNQNALDNEEIYYGSSFKGNTLFNYKEVDNKNVSINKTLKRRLAVKGYGNYLFDNTITSQKYTYKNLTGDIRKDTEITGYKFFKINGKDEYLNSWYLSKDLITQYVMTEITVTDKRNEVVFKDERDLELHYEKFELAYEPSDSDYKENIFVYLNGKALEKGSKAGDKTFFIDGKNLYVSLDIGLQAYDVIFIRMLIDKVDEELVDGYEFDLPLMLTANAFNEDITDIYYNETFSQLESILKNQKGFEGIINGANNYKDTKKDVSLGTKILQHSTPILKTMLLNTKEYTNVKTVLTYINEEYTKFKNKFNSIINTMVLNNEYKQYDRDWNEINPLVYVVKALNKINIGKDGLQPFYNNGVAEQLINLNEDDEDYLKYPYIPATPAYLGLDNCYKPEFISKDNLGLSQDVLLCHDGSYSMISGNYSDKALLELEEQIYESINDDFKKGLPKLIKQKYIPGKFRKTEYSYNEYIKLLTPLFEKWCIDNNYDYASNTTYDENNPFTWNWSTMIDQDGMQLPGSYRGIYLYYYDTISPNKTPWEMLGFGSMPEWWEEHYGKAPYTSDNIPMWQDIEEGHIIDGISEGYYEEFKRPGLIEKYLPVDEEGNLLDPYKAGIAKATPIDMYARRPWKIGDVGLVENSWRYTSEYRYSLQTLLYEMKPLEWVEKTWDSVDMEVLFKNTPYEQLINSNSGIRNVQTDIIMHNEFINDEYVRKIGTQQWFSDFLSRENINITSYIANDIRNMGLNLGYRCAGFYDKDSMRILSDNYGLIPSVNYKLKLSEKLTGDVFSYSGILIEKVSEGWMIDGFDYEHPYFDALTPNKNGKKTSIEVGGRSFTYYNEYKNDVQTIKYKTLFTSAQELYNLIIGYGKYLESKGFVFNTIDENSEQIDFRSCAKKFLLWYQNSDVQDGMILLLNPMDKNVTLKHSGFVDVVGKYFNGFWSVNDTLPSPIYNKNLRVYRHNGYITIKPKGNLDIANIKLTTCEKENVLLIDNETIYGDILYNTLKGIKTERFKLLGIKTNGWNGTYFAPGYVINKNETIEPNYDKLANDFNYVYDSDDIRSFSKMGDEARKTIGYHKTNYMENLLVDNRNMFDFYKGMLKEKGTKKAFNKLNRSTHIMSEGSSNLQLFEHWAFDLGQFGFTKNKSITELLIRADDISHDPQLITFSTDPNYVSTDDSNIDINWSNEDWLKKNFNQDRNTFVYKDYSKKLTTGGFARIGDSNYIVETKEYLDENIDNIEVGQKIWVVKDNQYTWNMYKKIDDEENPLKSLKVKNFKELSAYNCLNLSGGDLIYVENDILDEYRSILGNDDSGKEVSLYISDPQGFLKNPNYLTKNVGWSVFKFNEIKPYSYIISSPNGVMSITNNETEYTAEIENDLLVNMPDGLDENNNKKYVSYKIERDIPLPLNNEYKYCIVNDEGDFFEGTRFDTSIYNVSSTTATNEFYYDEETNLLKKWNGLYWESSADKLYGWEFNGETIYTLTETPEFDTQTYKFNGKQIILGEKVYNYKPKCYAWKYNDNIFYTLKESVSSGDKVYSSDRETIVDYISSYFDGSDYFYCDNKKYVRDEDNDYNESITINYGHTEYIRNNDELIEPNHYALLGEIYLSQPDPETSFRPLIDLVPYLPFTLERVEQKPINTDIIKSVYLVDNDNDKTMSKMIVYNPLYGAIPSVCSDEIDYITSYDPVNYNDPARWYDEKVGEVWWDTSKVRYLDYYQSDLIYRRNNWGKQLPGSEIALMEWSKSTILPEDATKYITREVYNSETDKVDTFYYFWVKNPITIPELDFRKTSCYDLSRKINSPQDEGMLWFAPIDLNDRLYDDSSFIIGNFDDVTASKDFVVQINYRNIDDVDDHHEWFMIIEDSDEDIPDKLWNKMKDSLITEVVVDGESLPLPDPSLTESEKYGIMIRPRQSMFKNVYKARRNFVDAVNDVLSSRDVRSSSSDDVDIFNETDTNYGYEISETFPSHEEMMKNKDKSLIGYYVLVESDEFYDNIWTVWKMNGINDYELMNYQKYSMSRYVYYIDAFLNDEYNKNTYNKRVYASYNDKLLNELKESGIPDGYIVRIDNSETKEWMYLMQYDEKTGTFVVVGIKDGYIQIKDSIYSYLKNPDNSKFIDGESKFDYLDNEVKKVIEIICNYFYNN